MERCRKKDMLSMAAVMMRANDSISKASRTNRQEVEEMLIQCQDAAIRMGTYLESFGAKYTHIVRILEDYCENIYQVSVSLSDANVCRSLSQIIRSLITEFQNRIQGEMPDDRKEIVFLPYKASMWDSLESVWKAADADENADVYVIPIPYYDRNPDGSFGKEHYEGNLYPAYVPITGYREYDFESRRPDMIFIHNAYDQGNYVTSVHPFFYSNNLKRYTDQLVYIPYFILEEIDPENQEAVERISHFCTVPGVFYADKVIVQSEKMRQVYIDVLSHLAGENTKDYWKGKICGTGSPKIDGVLSIKSKHSAVPDNWIKLINKPDGTKKKVILYNTTINALLHNNEKYLKKIKNVLELLKEKSNEIALLWRPHPLLESALMAMRPGLLEMYIEIKQEYLKEGWGIYDNTQDLGRAITISDAYYGDASSVVQLYEETGKASMLQNMEICRNDGRYSIYDKALISENIYQDGQNIWMTSLEYNALLLWDKKMMKLRLVGVFPEEKFLGKRLFTSTALCDGKLYFAPYMAEQIAEYDPASDQFKRLYVPFAGKDVNHPYIYRKFNRVVAIGDRVYFIPAWYPGILCYDTKTEKISCFDDWVDKVEAFRTSKLAYFREYILDKGRLILPCACADAVVIFNTLTESSQVFKLQKTKNVLKYCGICQNGKEFWLITGNGEVFIRKLEAEKEAVRKIMLPSPQFDNFFFYPIRSMGGYVYLFPFDRKRERIRINICTEEIECKDLSGSDDDEGALEWPILCASANSEEMFVFERTSRSLITFDKEGEKIREDRLFLSGDDKLILAKMYNKDFGAHIFGNCVRETEEESLDSLLMFLSCNETTESIRNEEDPNYGARIYDSLLNT